MVYDNRHRTLLQAIMQGGAVLEHDASLICTKIFGERLNVASVAQSINEKLAPLAMAMKSGICEMSGEKYWSIVGTTHEESITVPSQFNTGQRAFLREIYSEIISADDGCISSTDCLNMSTTLDVKLSISDADIFLKYLTKGKWLLIKNGYVFMGVRSIVELMPYFRATYQDNFHNCTLCKEIVFHGQKCENCDKVFHYYCLAKYASMQNESKCPQCRHTLDTSYTSFVADESTTSQVANGNREEQPMDVSEDDNDNGDEDDDDSENSPPMRRFSKRTRTQSK
ncbi:hypothetical protein TSAR_008035 [Trichomalopsis sarcophagae]|uniref:Non-structural maintenance of chromosomes element 1 homolog n=1 Tax=Trichomalopsis sarcophagae TaxID=543379 RepID=A0A232EW33_9HYME|nr:hypothetical protein TSAR_008035 [Trichomalopsis sarcophagae]